MSWGWDQGNYNYNNSLVPVNDPSQNNWGSSGNEAFVTFGRGNLKTFNAHKNFGFISPIFRSEDSEGPPLNLGSADGLWFYGNHSLPARAVLGSELTFEIWENEQGKSQARNVQLATEITQRPEERLQEYKKNDDRDQRGGPRRHANEPKVIYPSVYVSDVPVEYTENTIRDLHRQLGLNPDTIMGLKYLPFTEVSLGGKKEKVAPVTGAVIIRYQNDDAANAAVERLKGHPIRTSEGVSKHLGAKHAAPAKWVMQRRQDEEDEKKATNSRGESLMQKVKGIVARVSMSGYGVIKSAEYGEVMWRQYELPTNIRTLQFADPAKFKADVEKRAEYQRLKAMENKEVEAELYKLPDGQIRAWHVRALGGNAGYVDGATSSSALAYPPNQPPPGQYDPNAPPSAEQWPAHGNGPPGGKGEGMPGMAQFPPMMPGGPGGPPGMGPPGMGGMPPYGDPYYQAQMMQMMQMGMMGKKEKKKDKKDKKDKKEKKRRREEESEDNAGRSASPPQPKRREIDDDDF